MRACGLRVNNNMVQESFEVFLCMLKKMEGIIIAGRNAHRDFMSGFLFSIIKIQVW